MAVYNVTVDNNTSEQVYDTDKQINTQYDKLDQAINDASRIARSGAGLDKAFLSLTEAVRKIRDIMKEGTKINIAGRCSSEDAITSTSGNTVSCIVMLCSVFYAADDAIVEAFQLCFPQALDGFHWKWGYPAPHRFCLQGSQDALCKLMQKALGSLKTPASSSQLVPETKVPSKDLVQNLLPTIIDHHKELEIRLTMDMRAIRMYFPELELYNFTELMDYLEHQPDSPQVTCAREIVESAESKMDHIDTLEDALSLLLNPSLVNFILRDCGFGVRNSLDTAYAESWRACPKIKHVADIRRDDVEKAIAEIPNNFFHNTESIITAFEEIGNILFPPPRSFPTRYRFSNLDRVRDLIDNFTESRDKDNKLECEQ